MFKDNFGTSEEKLFLKFFNQNIKPQLDEKKLKYYVVRNERFPELSIYSFENGNRFEPDFILFILKDENNIVQNYVEPKGFHLITNDIWKENFLTQITTRTKEIKNINNTKYNYKIIGLPFFNSELEEKKAKIKQTIASLISDIEITY